MTREESSIIDQSGMREHVMQLSLPDELMPRAYANARALVFPSRYEGFGLPVLEAMASGTPAVLCDSSALPEVGGSAASYFKVGDYEDLANELVTLLADSSLQDKMRHEGMLRAKEFSWSRAAQQTADVYRSVVGDK